MKLTKIYPDLDKTHPVTFKTIDITWKCIESIQDQVEEQHRKTIWKYTRTNPYKLSKEILERMHIVLIVDPQHNRQWLEQKGHRIGPVVETNLVLNVNRIE